MTKGFWANSRAYMVSLLKAYWGPAATAENGFCFDYLPRLTGDHSTYATVLEQLNGRCKGYFLFGQNPAVGSANTRMQRLGMANLDWLVVRDMTMIESATWWQDGPEIETGEMRTAGHQDRGVLPARRGAHREGGQLHQHPAACCSGTTRRCLRPATRAATCGSPTTWAGASGRSWPPRPRPTDDRDRPVLDLTWDYPVLGPLDEPSAEAVLAEVNGWDADGQPLSGFAQLKDDGSTACGCWIYSGAYAGGVNQTARRKPGSEQSWVAPEWGWAWPANRRILYNRASADPEGKPWSERKAYVWWDAEAGKWAGHDVPDFPATRPPSYRPAEGATGVDAISGIDAFIMQNDGKAWLYAPAGLADGPLPTHYEPQESPFRNPLYGQQRNPIREIIRHKENPLQPSGAEPGSSVFPYVATTYRLTEHHTAGGMSRTLPYLSELQPEFFCEVSPELAAERGLEHRGWATIITARTAVEARVLVTSRMRTLTIGGRPAAPGRAALPLGAERPGHRRRGQRTGLAGPRPERAHPGGQGDGLRHPPRPPPARPRAAPPGPRVQRARGHHRRDGHGGPR